MVTQIHTFATPGRATVSGDARVVLLRGSRAAAPGTPAAECAVVRAVEGRVRLRIPRLTRFPELGERLRARLMCEPGIQSVRVNTACASIIVSFDARRATVAEIQDWLIRAAGAPATRRVQPAEPSAPRERRAPTLLAGAAAIAAMAISPHAGPRMLQPLRQWMKPSDLLDLVLSGMRGDLRLALLSVAVVVVARFARTAIARGLRAARADLRPQTTLELPLRWAPALAA